VRWRLGIGPPPPSDLTAAGGACASGADYVPVNQYVVFPAGSSSSQMVPITLCPESLAQGAKTFRLELQAHALHRPGEPRGARADALRLLAHGVDPETRHEALENLAPPGQERAVERRPVHEEGRAAPGYRRRARTTWAMRRMCSGVEPQQAPITVAPASRSAGYSRAMASGSSS
jgi:hypothetical protein